MFHFALFHRFSFMLRLNLSHAAVIIPQLLDIPIEFHGPDSTVRVA